MSPHAPSLLDRLDAALSGGPAETYPLLPGESASAWRAESKRALRALVPRLEEVGLTGETLGAALDAVAQGPMAASLARKPGRVRLLGELLRNLADPGRINQGHKGTCAVACVEIHLAEALPAEYARLVAGLMSPTGRARLAGGDELRRDEDRLEWHKAEARRSPVSRLVQAAAMDFAYPEFDYCNYVDRLHDAQGQNQGTGVGLDAFDRLLESVTGQKWERLTDTDRKQAQLLAQFGVDPASLPDLERDAERLIRASLAAGDGVFVTLEATLPEGASAATVDLLKLPHKVRVLRIDDSAGRIWYDDPLDPEEPWLPDVDTRVENQDGHCSMELSDFLGLVVELSCRTEHFGFS